MFPSHAIEGSIQLYHDWPKLREAAIRLKEYYDERAEVPPKVREAIEVIDNVMDAEYTVSK